MDNNNWNTYEQGQYSSQTTQEQQNTYSQYGGTQNDFQGYQAYQPVEATQTDEVVKISEYLLPLLLLTFIPCAGIIVMIVFAFSSKEKESKRNFCKAYLITLGITYAVAIVVAIIYAVFAASIMQY